MPPLLLLDAADAVFSRCCRCHAAVTILIRHMLRGIRALLLRRIAMVRRLYAINETR